MVRESKMHKVGEKKLSDERLDLYVYIGGKKDCSIRQAFFRLYHTRSEWTKND